MKERKIRDEGRMRKMVAPKHALLAINEIKGVTISDFTYTLASNTPVASFLAEATINGIAYQGRGPSKNAAKTDVCDQALRDIMVARMAAQAKAQEENREATAEEEVPILTLVSYAIHRMFADWEAQGYCMKCGGAKSLDPLDPCTCNGSVTSIAHLLKREDGPAAGTSSAAGSSKTETSVTVTPSKSTAGPMGSLALSSSSDDDDSM